MPEKAADNFSDDQAESGDHGPTEYGGSQRGMHVRMIVAVMRMADVLVAVLVRGFGRIAGLDRRSVRVLVHPEIFYAFERRRAAAPQSYYAV